MSIQVLLSLTILAFAQKSTTPPEVEVAIEVPFNCPEGCRWDQQCCGRNCLTEPCHGICYPTRKNQLDVSAILSCFGNPGLPPKQEGAPPTIP
ncbi:hypothetical protein QR680_006119 [Steinernema hermaphroditum]|uniref:WAP domain-containing protein n=1 Tax=Steinernema hermaphroditum TaxID=289476 RepID=A0AA39LW04_9BILA|nr:hypothetical protein QR680_006119 [Steinernema hermaphroditum]